uniref:Solute carrier family 30 member 4 n=1 Tax=Eptatretus burgeri TaxID=7764 RepID=A0A8C4WZI1_EPTBU
MEEVTTSCDCLGIEQPSNSCHDQGKPSINCCGKETSSIHHHGNGQGDCQGRKQLVGAYDTGQKLHPDCKVMRQEMKHAAHGTCTTSGDKSHTPHSKCVCNGNQFTQTEEWAVDPKCELELNQSGDDSDGQDDKHGICIRQRQDRSLGDDGHEEATCLGCRLKLETKEKNQKSRSVLILAGVLYTLFMIAEFVGGTIANSLAVMTDALHLLTDLVGIVLSLGAMWLAQRPGPLRLPFGLYRAEALASLLSVLLIWLLTGVLVYQACLRIWAKDFELQADPMIITSGLGVIVNIVMGLLLHQSGHGHSHGHSHLPRHTKSQGHAHSHDHGHSHDHSHSHDHDHTHDHGDSDSIGHNNNQNNTRHNNSHNHDQPVSLSPAQCEAADHGSSEGQKKPGGHGPSLLVRAAFVHALGDLAQSMGVLIAAYIIRFKPEYKIADPICTFLFSVLVLMSTTRILWDTTLLLMEGTPRHVDINEIHLQLAILPGVHEVERLYVWGLSTNVLVAIVQLQLEPGADWSEVRLATTRLLVGSFKIHACAVDIRPAGHFTNFRWEKSSFSHRFHHLTSAMVTPCGRSRVGGKRTNCK